jgi:hypothetical protein
MLYMAMKCQITQKHVPPQTFNKSHIAGDLSLSLARAHNISTYMAVLYFPTANVTAITLYLGNQSHKNKMHHV